jgi:hypothetical protein
MNTETFTETRRNKIASWQSTITVTRTPATLSKSRMTRARWFDYVGDHVTACFEVEVTVKSEHGEPRTEKFLEIVTPHGRGCVVAYGDGDEELNVFIPNSGKALLYGFWRKHGHMVGHAGYYVRGNHLNADSRSKVDHTCPAVIYATASGKKLGA